MCQDADRRDNGRLLGLRVLLGAVLVGAAPLASVHAQAGDGSAPDDRLEAFLLDRGMLELLVRQLESRLDRTTLSRERTEVAERLASVYARLLSDADSAEDQRRWERSAARLLSLVPDANTLELRLSLARAAYTRVESVAERYRLRMADDAERTDALLRLRDLRGRFVVIARDADRRVRELEREEERSPRVESGWLAEALGQARRQRSMAQYLAGWSAYFLAELGDDAVSHATDAIVSFGWLLGADRNAEPDLAGLGVASLRYEHIARAALATAMCYGLRGQTGTAEEWLTVLDEAPEVPGSVREQVFSRRLALRARAGEWSSVAMLVSEKRRSPALDQLEGGYVRGEPLSVSNARLLAVEAFEELERRGSQAYTDWRIARLRDIALGDLVVTEQLGHVLDLAGIYNTERFGDSSFVALHVRGLALYQSARDQHEQSGRSEAPSEAPEVVAQYRRAAELLEHAQRAVDASAFEAAGANTSLLIGLARFYGGRAASGEGGGTLFISSADALEDASARFSDPRRGADALWMAIRALDQIEETVGVDGASEVGVRRDELVKRFLQTYPDDEKSAALIIRLAESESIPASDRLSLLRGVPASNPLRESALRYATSLAYSMYRDADSEADRDFASDQFVELAEPLIAIDQRRGLGGDRAAQRAAVARARQAADAALSVRVPDLSRAERIVDVLHRMLLDGFAGATEAESEILFRRAQLALAKGDQRGAEQIVDQLRDRGDEFAAPSVRVFYRDAAIEYERVIGAQADRAVVLAAAERLISAGADLLVQLEGQDSLSEGDRTLVVAVRIRIGRAAQQVWRMSGDDDLLRVAYARFRDALQEQPRNVEALRGVGQTGEAAGEPEAALDAWRLLLSGLPAESEAWFEARTEHLAILARLDPDRARQVIRQHAVLYPAIGPAPYRERLIGIAAGLGIELRAGGGS